jgi:hypothetical protein
MRKLLLAAIVLAGIFPAACGPNNPPKELPCQLSVDCQTDNGQCFTCNPGFVCGDGVEGGVACVKKDVTGGGPWTVTATGCPPRMVFDYSGNSYNMCYNSQRAAKLYNCSNVVSNCR